MWQRLGSVLPGGQLLPEGAWQARHKAILWAVWLHAVGIGGYVLWQGAGPLDAVLHAAPVGATAALAMVQRLPRRVRASLATLGCMASSAVLVHLSHGLIEMHFHFFVMLAVITFYQEWRTFLLAIAFVVVEHAVVGVIAPHAVYSHGDAWVNPVKWAVVHALFVAGASAAAITNWRLTEQAQTAERALAARLAYEANHDPLTGALNRRELDRRLDGMSGPGQPPRHALCFLDLDRFKVVNDACGHAAGDQLLRQVTDLIRGGLGRDDLLARVGGDEFVVVLADCTTDRAAEVADRLHRRVTEHRFGYDGQVFTIGVSIGVVPLAGVDHAGHESLLAADAACYAAKYAGRSRVHVARPDDRRLNRQQQEANWAARVMAALDNDEFVLFHQAIVPVEPGTGGRFGELLLRLPAEDGTMITPAAFLPAAERYHLLPALDRWVIGTAFAALAGCTHGPGDMYSINLSGASFGDPMLVPFIREQLTRHRLRPSTICFEVTETVAITDLGRAAAFISELRTLGCRFALDDFGTGLSSFTYLKRLPVDFVKIDGTFVRGMPTDAVDRAMVEAVNRISHEMGLRTIAEFVEDDIILGELRAIGVDYAQGMAIDRPGPLADRLHGDGAVRVPHIEPAFAAG